jgi:hypothetical protein
LWADEIARRSELGLLTETTKMTTHNESDWPMSMKETKALRLELMQERATFVEQFELGFEEYNLCEH